MAVQKLPAIKRTWVIRVLVVLVLAAAGGAAFYYLYYNTPAQREARFLKGQTELAHSWLDDYAPRLSEPNLSAQEKFNLNGQAAIAAAGLGMPEAQDYAKAALEAYKEIPKSAGVPIGASPPVSLQRIADGNYEKK